MEVHPRPVYSEVPFIEAALELSQQTVCQVNPKEQETDCVEEEDPGHGNQNIQAELNRSTYHLGVKGLRQVYSPVGAQISQCGRKAHFQGGGHQLAKSQRRNMPMDQKAEENGVEEGDEHR